MRALLAILFAAACCAVEPPQPVLQAAPIEGLKANDLRDMFEETHNGHRHEAIDIMEAKGTPVHAVVSGPIKKLFLSKPGGITVYQFDDAGVFCYYYAHLDRYADGVVEGMHVNKGDVIAYVGSTGNADPGAPHLHFAISRLGPDKKWWEGPSVDPYPALKDVVTQRTVR